MPALKSLPAGSAEDEIYSALSIAPNIHRASGLWRNSNRPPTRRRCSGVDSAGGRAGPICRSAAAVIKSNKGKRDDRFHRLRPTKCHVACPSQTPPVFLATVPRHPAVPPLQFAPSLSLTTSPLPPALLSPLQFIPSPPPPPCGAPAETYTPVPYSREPSCLPVRALSPP